MKKRAIIIGGGPAGLTTAYELLKRTDIHPVVLEKSDTLGGISRTVVYKGNRMDIGGHRFFSKSDRVMEWWLEILPLQQAHRPEEQITYQGRTRTIQTSTEGPDPAHADEVMLVRGRKSRIYFLRKFFEYPITLSKETLLNLGLVRTIRIGISYVLAVLFPIRNEKNLEQFFVNRFGRELYLTFFKSYTEKVWGVACSEISAEWGAQRIKGLSITKTVLHILKKIFGGGSADLSQKGTETSLIEKFLYPKLGPGQMWEEVAKRVQEMGGEVLMEQDVRSIEADDGRVRAVRTATQTFEGDYFFSTMPVQELIRSLEGVTIPAPVREVSDGLMYRDFITVGLLLKKLKVREAGDDTASRLIRDNWIYVQEPDVLAGRLQIFNNWSPYLVSDPDKVWVGVEYFCYEGDELWRKPVEEMKTFAAEELTRIGIIDRDDVLDATVIHMPKTYPAYFGTYDRFEEVREYVDGFANLFLLGRNGMHKYNNQDHSMLTAMTAVDNIIAGRADKSNIWATNTEQEYHESK
jgi:protoporphyrinogen oxidase